MWMSRDAQMPSDVSAWDCVPYAGELLQSWFQDSWEVNPTSRERLNPLMTRSLFTIEEDRDRPQTAHLAVTTEQA